MGILQARILEGLPCPPAGDLPNPGIEPRSPAFQVDSLPAELPGKPRKAIVGTFDHKRITKIYFLYMHLEETVKR